MISTFHKDYPKKLIITLLLINSVLPIVKLIAKLVTKRVNAIKKKCDRLTKAFVKQIKEV